MMIIAAKAPPEVIPIMPGSAKGFRKIPCKITPAKARFMPAKNPTTTRGKRIVMII